MNGNLQTAFNNGKRKLGHRRLLACGPIWNKGIGRIRSPISTLTQLHSIVGYKELAYIIRHPAANWNSNYATFKLANCHLEEGDTLVGKIRKRAGLVYKEIRQSRTR